MDSACISSIPCLLIVYQRDVVIRVIAPSTPFISFPPSNPVSCRARRQKHPSPSHAHMSNPRRRIYRWLKNQLVLFPLLASPPSPSCFCRLPMTGKTGPSATAPPPRRGLAIREPTPPKPAYEAPPAGEPRPRVEPALADSRRSLTAVSWASKL
jgi:hypothetical protein